MKKTVLAATTALSVAVLSLATATTASAELKVGMITTLSGGGASLGVDVRDGFQLALKMAGDQQIELLIEDDGRKPENAVKIADKFISSDKVDVLTGIIWSNLAMAVVPKTVRGGTFYISPNAGPSALAGKGCHENYFNAAWQNDNLHEAMGNYANDAGYSKSFILAPNYPAGKDALTGYKRFYKGDAAGEIYTKLGQTDYAAEIAQIKNSDADSVFFFLPGGMGIAFMKQYAQSGVDLPVLGPAFSFDQGILGAVGDAALGVKNSSQWSKDLPNPANKAFVEAFTEEYGRLPSLYASQGFDTANLILSAAAKTEVSDKGLSATLCVQPTLKSVRGDFSFGPNHHPIQNIYVREVIKEGDVLTNKIVSTGLENHSDAYAVDCKM